MSRRVKVAEADITMRDLSISNEGHYASAYLLLRKEDTLLQMVRLSFKNGQVGREEILNAGRHHASYHLALDDLKRYTGIPTGNETLVVPISVVVCTRNRTQLLKKCIEALKELDYPEFEILVVDNAPDNNETRDLVLSNGLRYIREDMPGLDRARNRGIKESVHPLIAFTDDDARPDKNWLKAIAGNFKDEHVMAVTGYVAPAELETYAQQLFEWSYGGMGHGFSKRVFNGDHMSERAKLAASGLGVGANMAFRRSWFDKGGYFDPALDVGTPSCGGGDIEMFHRVVSHKGTLVYEPNALVWHLHRPEMDALYRQIFNNGRSFVCYLLTCHRNGTTGTLTLVRFFLYNWLFQWHFKNIFFGGGKVSRKLLLTELKGMLTGPSAYVKSRKFAARTDHE